jgi:RecJ-like exonuclease
MCFALAKYGCDEDAKRRLLGFIVVYIGVLACNENWSAKDASLFMAMAKLVIDEVISENLCPNCHGIGLVKIKVCNVCNGTRHKVMSGRKKASVIGVTQVQWSRTWSSRYESVFEYVHSMDCLIKRTIGKHSAEKTLQ